MRRWVDGMLGRRDATKSGLGVDDESLGSMFLGFHGLWFGLYFDLSTIAWISPRKVNPLFGSICRALQIVLVRSSGQEPLV